MKNHGKKNLAGLPVPIVTLILLVTIHAGFVQSDQDTSSHTTVPLPEGFIASSPISSSPSWTARVAGKTEDSFRQPPVQTTSLAPDNLHGDRRLPYPYQDSEELYDRPATVNDTDPCPASHPALTSPCERQRGQCITPGKGARKTAKTSGRKVATGKRSAAEVKQCRTVNATQCSSQQLVLRQLQGTIVWRSDVRSCFQEWRLAVSGQSGFVIEFHQVKMTGLDYLEINSYDENNMSDLHRNFSRVPGDSWTVLQSQQSLAPVLLNGGEIVIRITMFDKEECLPVSKFNLSYTAVNESLPRVIKNAENDTESDVTYDCAGFARLPKVITCDGIHHCQDGEDERHCAYCQQGCGDWLPYGAHCLKATFVRDLLYVPGHSTMTVPLEAERSCWFLNATLAVLPDPKGLDIVAGMIRKSGFRNAVVGIKKMKPMSLRLRHLYRYLWQWGERGHPVAYEQQELQRSGMSSNCAVLVADPKPHLESIGCSLPNPPPHGYVCMRPNPTLSVKKLRLSGIGLLKSSAVPTQFPTKQCADGSVVQVFHHCRWGQNSKDLKKDWSPSNLPVFQCYSGHTVHYSLLCDGKDDCVDGSDEKDCKHPQFAPLLHSSFVCRNSQAISADKRCDGTIDCFDESDEESCVSCGTKIMCHGVGCVPRNYWEYFDTCPQQPVFKEELLLDCSQAMVRLDGSGMSRLEVLSEACGEGYYYCHEGFTIPSYLLNNGERDCPHGEDEDIPVHNMTCPGFYRCQDTGSCVHNEFVCDGVYHCPNKDDEMFCKVACPTEEGCKCEGWAYTCSRMIEPRQHLHVRYLDLSHASGVSLENIHFMEYLFFLNLSHCQLTSVTITDMPHLHTLDLSFNFITDLANVSLHGLSDLKYLDLSNNPFIEFVSSAFFDMLVSNDLNDLKILMLANVSLKSIEKKMFSPLPKLVSLDIRNNPIRSYDKGSLSGLITLQTLYTDVRKLCCSYFHSSLSQCYAPADELSSCTDLLAQDFFRVCLWAMSVLAIAGNAGVLIYRLAINKQASNRSFRILVMNLCASDLVMGVYMMMIGIADAQFRGVYIAKERQWTESPACLVAGFLCFMSSEVSAFIICLITLDRVLVICFPLKPRVHLGQRVILNACGMIWAVGLVLATVPIIAGMEFYGQNSICVPLPITRKQFSGQVYAFAIFIVLNFVIFVLIGVGQLLIYRAVHKASAALAKQRRQQDLSVTRHLFLVVFTDFCCWFPIGLMGLLASTGIPVSSQLNVWAAIFVLPLNSALNPFLYTLNRLQEQWKQRRALKRETISMVNLNVSGQIFTRESSQLS